MMSLRENKLADVQKMCKDAGQNMFNLVLSAKNSGEVTSTSPCFNSSFWSMFRGCDNRNFEVVLMGCFVLGKFPVLLNLIIRDYRFLLYRERNNLLLTH